MLNLTKGVHNGYWLASLVILSGLTAWIYFSDARTAENYDDNQFKLEVNSIITTINISSNTENLNFEFKEGSWIVNDSFPMDPGMRDAFFTVISSIKIKRPVSIVLEDSITDFLLRSGHAVEILNNGDLILSYLVGGDEIAGISYFMDKDAGIPYEVVLPGYDSYVAGIYEVPLKDWRDRFIFQLNWSNLKYIRVEYAHEEKMSFEIEYKEDFFYLDQNPDPLDSAVMFDYMGELMNLQAEKFLLPGDDPVSDSLAGTLPAATITVGIIGMPDQSLDIFPQPKPGKFVLARFNNDLLVLFDPRSLGPVLMKSDDWD